MQIACRNKRKLRWSPYSGTDGSKWGELFGDAVPEGVTIRAHNHPNKNGRSYKWTVYATFDDNTRNSVENTRRGFNEALEATLEEING